GTSIDDLRRQIFDASTSTQIILLRCDRKPPTFPAVCPNCEAVASGTFTIERPFILLVYGDDDTPNDSLPVVDSYSVPVCKNCLQQHRTQQLPLSPFLPLKRVLSGPQGFAGLVVIAISGLFFKEALIHLRLVPFVLGCFPLFIGLGLIRPVWRKSQFMTIPQPTPTDLAVDFTPCLSLDYEPNWRAFHFRSHSYATLFRQANNSELWDPKSPEAISAAAQRRTATNRSAWAAGAIVLAIIAALIWYEGPVAFFSSLFD
ncbi:MAG: hypothetical protein NTW74_24315, partial [Acidobacteria bacterium]|nr:hypothetical protein [Acidobacteriota bacterium]